MSLETDIRARLVADAGVSALVVTRVYAAILPQKPTLPALTYQRVSGARLRSLTGASGRGFARIQIDSWADTYVGAQALAAAVRTSLHGFIGDTNGRGVVIGLDNERDIYESDPDYYRVTQDYTVNHEE